MSFSLHPRAAQDLADAVAFYRDKASARVAARFLDEFERIALLLTTHPGFGTPFDLPRRSFPLRVFPYAVIYRPSDEGIRIPAVRHHRRHPRQASGRDQ